MLTGNFRHTVFVDQPAQTTGPGGKVTTEWLQVFRLRAELVSNDTVEARGDNGARETMTLIFRTHFRAGITTGNRLMSDGKPFNIVKIVEIEQRRGLELHCEALS